MSIKKILFMGTPDYATCILKELLASSYEVIALFTQEDKKVGRKQILSAPHIKQYCLEQNIDIPIYQPKKLRDNDEAYEQIKALAPDIIIVAAYGQILPKNILDLAPCMNLHASLLPKYRGASPIQEAILNDDSYTGVTAMFMEEGLDTGDILGLQYLKLEDKMEVAEVFDKLSIIAAKLTLDTLDNFENIKPKKQNNALSSLCKKIKKEHGEVSFKNAKKLYQTYKAYSYWPGVFLASGLKIKEISLINQTSINKEGEILGFDTNAVIIGCEEGSLKINVLQAPSKKAVNAADYIRGQRLSIGEVLK